MMMMMMMICMVMSGIVIFHNYYHALPRKEGGIYNQLYDSPTAEDTIDPHGQSVQPLQGLRQPRAEEQGHSQQEFYGFFPF